MDLIKATIPLSILISLSSDVLGLLQRLVRTTSARILALSPNDFPNSKGRRFASRSSCINQKDVSNFFNNLNHSLAPMKQVLGAINGASVVLARSLPAIPSNVKSSVSEGSDHSRPIPTYSLHPKVAPARVPNESPEVKDDYNDHLVIWPRTLSDAKNSMGSVLHFLVELVETLKKDPEDTLYMKCKEPIFLQGMILALAVLGYVKQTLIHIDDIWSLD